MFVIWELSEEEHIFFFILNNFNANSLAEKIERTKSEGRQTREEPMAVVSLEMMRVLAIQMKKR